MTIRVYGLIYTILTIVIVPIKSFGIPILPMGQTFVSFHCHFIAQSGD